MKYSSYICDVFFSSVIQLLQLKEGKCKKLSPFLMFGIFTGYLLVHKPIYPLSAVYQIETHLIGS